MIENSIKIYKNMVRARTEDCINYQKEIERLNNIINELEKYLNDDDWTSVNGVIAIKLIKIKLKELKEGK